MTTSRDPHGLGRRGEDLAAAHLSTLGLTLLDRNWRDPGGEIDLVAADGELLVAVEVKTRRSERFGHPFQAVDARKILRLHRLALAWLRAHPDAGYHGHRVDVLGIVLPDEGETAIEYFRAVRP